MFGKKQQKKVETQSLGLDQSSFKEATKEFRPIENIEVVKEEIAEQAKIKGGIAKLISIELIDNELIKTTFISNGKMGELGDEFDI